MDDIGDICDNNNDGDSLLDREDNCKWIPNSGYPNGVSSH